MMTIPVEAEFRGMSREVKTMIKDGKESTYEVATVSVEPTGSTLAVVANNAFGAKIPDWLTPEYRGKKITLIVSELFNDKGATRIKFSDIIRKDK